MSLLKYMTLVAVSFATTMPVAADQRLIGVWHPITVEADHADWSVLVFSHDQRFSALTARDTNQLTSDDLIAVAVSESSSRTHAEWVSTVVSGVVTIGVDGGEVVLAVDGTPGRARYVQMLLLGNELHPYPGMVERSSIATKSWRRVDDGFRDNPDAAAQ